MNDDKRARDDADLRRWDEGKPLPPPRESFWQWLWRKIKELFGAPKRKKSEREDERDEERREDQRDRRH